MDAVNGELAADFAVLDCPAAFILGTGGHSGAPAEETQRMRASVAVAQAASQRVSVFATAPCNHTAILRKCPDLVVAAIKDVAALAGGPGGSGRDAGRGPAGLVELSAGNGERLEGVGEGS
jgi:hypothetical protein